MEKKNKRSIIQENLRSPKRTRTFTPSNPTLQPNHTLDRFVNSSKPDPIAIHITKEIKDRQSIFKAIVFKVKSLSDVTEVLQLVQHRFHSNPPSHNITAWRFLKLKKSCDGLGGPGDFELESGYEDDGEARAGSKVLKIMESLQIIDAIVVVSRWYGGVLLGPARFDHIECCATDACKVFQSIDALDDDISRLTELDLQLSKLRIELKMITDPSFVSTSSPSGSQPLSNPYQHLRNPVNLIGSAKLITAREKAITTLHKLIKEAKDKKSSASNSIDVTNTPEPA
ncbi:hypothetical protein DFH28DRAFT_923489 [Melampsora americana]|nr:hypothetical protein DFH28DRAFT_923489 [Melampsora americana]